MVSSTHRPLPNDAPPAWDIARLFPSQGAWSEAEYLSLTDGHNQLVEWTDGYVEVLAMPNFDHQRIVRFVFQALFAFATAHKLGEVIFAPLRVRLRPGMIREPDVVFMKLEHADRMGAHFWDGADLAVEVVSDDPNSRRRDLLGKREEYAAAGVPEYWIIDPAERRVTVLRLPKGAAAYEVHGEWVDTGTLTSPTLPGFTLSVEEILRSATVNPSAE
jgi:Uma2 family endonuclease